MSLKEQRASLILGAFKSEVRRQEMVTFSEVTTEIISGRSPFTDSINDTKADWASQGGASEGPKTKRACTSKIKDVSFYIPEHSDGLKALTNASHGLQLRKESIGPGTHSSSAGRGLASTDDAWRQARAGLPNPLPTNKIVLKKKPPEVRSKRKALQAEETEKVRRMFQMLDTRELKEAAMAHIAKSEERTWLIPVDASRKVLSLRPLTALPNLVQPEGKCTECKKLQNRMKTLEVRGSEVLKLHRKIHELEDRAANTNKQNEWFRERNEWLEARLRALEIQHAEQRSTIKPLGEKNEGGSTSSGSSFLPTLSSGRRMGHLHRVTQNIA